MSDTLKELRAKAKARGLKGYSKLTKDELVRELEAKTPAITASAAKETSARAQPSSKERPSPPPKKVPPTAKSTAPKADTKQSSNNKVSVVSTETRATKPAEATREATEEIVENAKYALRPKGEPAPLPSPDLGEDIDRLPPLNDPTVCLLPQKPGVLYAYWLMPLTEATQRADYKLRLSRLGPDTAQLLEEIAVKHERGGWYFHVPESVGTHELIVQLGYYRDGKFISAQGQSVARAPSLYASARTDHRWWVSQEEFERMYLRAGGMVTPARRYGWSASTGSPSSAPSSPGMSWPGGVKSS